MTSIRRINGTACLGKDARGVNARDDRARSSRQVSSAYVRWPGGDHGNAAPR